MVREDGKLSCVVKGPFDYNSSGRLERGEWRLAGWRTVARAAGEAPSPMMELIFCSCMSPGAFMPQKGCTCALASCLAQLCASVEVSLLCTSSGHSEWLAAAQLEQGWSLPPALPGQQQGEAVCCTQAGVVLPGGVLHLLPGSFLSTQSSLFWAPTLWSC